MTQVHGDTVRYPPPVGSPANPASWIPIPAPAGLPGGPASAGRAEAIRQHAAAVLQASHRWLEGLVPATPSASVLAPPLVTAVQLYESGQYDACLAQIAGVWQIAREHGFVVPSLAR